MNQFILYLYEVSVERDRAWDLAYSCMVLALDEAQAKELAAVNAARVAIHGELEEAYWRENAKVECVHYDTPRVIHTAILHG